MTYVIIGSGSGLSPDWSFSVYDAAHHAEIRDYNLLVLWSFSYHEI